LKGLLAQKIGLTRFNGNTATRWGKLLEEVTRQWSELVLCMEDEIKETGSVEGFVKNQRYSPDGLGIVELDGKHQIILFEFKAPLGLLPNGKVPKHYLPQILTGMASMPFVSKSIFVNNCYRKCPLSDLNFESTYDEKFHAGDFKKRKAGLRKSEVKGVGLIFFYTTDVRETLYKKYVHDEDAVINWEEPMGRPQAYTRDIDYDLLFSEELIDFGASDKFARLLDMYDVNDVSAYYATIKMNRAAVNDMPICQDQLIEFEETDVNFTAYFNNKLKHFLRFCTLHNYKPIGYLPWKLMVSDIIVVERDVLWEEQAKIRIEEAITFLEQIMSADDPEIKLRELFPEEPKEEVDVSCLEEFI